MNNLLRAITLFEISGVFVFSAVIIFIYVKRLSRQIDTNLTWHVIAVAVGSIVTAIGVFLFVFSRLSNPEIMPSLYFYLIGYGAMFIGQFFLFRRQIDRYHQGK